MLLRMTIQPPKTGEGPSADQPVVRTLVQTLWQEFTALHGERPPQKPGESDLSAYRRAAFDMNQAALCLSGGGIRSAAFSLGVIQALARKKLLKRFHYLSTVSGGGYIGGWLTMLIDEQGGDIDRVEKLLTDGTPDTAKPRDEAERFKEIGQLRQFTNYLTPDPGLASADTWAAITLYVRNILINWMLFLPALFALAGGPLLYRDLIESLSPSWGMGLLVAGYLCLAIGVFLGAAHLPSHAPKEDRTEFGTGKPTFFKAGEVVRLILAWAFLVPLIAAPSLRLAVPEGTTPLFLIPVGGFVVMIIAYITAGLWCDEQSRPFRKNFFWWALASAIASVLLDVGLELGRNRSADLLAIVGPLLVTSAHLVQSLFYVALRTEGSRGDLDREWLARLNALKVIPSLLWAMFAAVCLELPGLILDHWTSQFQPWVIGAFGVLTGPGAALLGQSGLTPFGREGKDPTSPKLPYDVIAGIATALFGALLFLLLARGSANLADALARHANSLGAAQPWTRWLVDVLLIVIPLLLSLFLGRRINVNRFSLHAVYRMRLVRAFLGSARIKRHPDGFTDIDPFDNPRLSDMFRRPAKDKQGHRLFPVINLALNLTAGHNHAWSERKAESFTVTPQACGAANLQRGEGARKTHEIGGAYVQTASYAGDEKETGPKDKGSGMTLGTAITLSGAAVSPNMGYSSSPTTSFLMTLFNVRLGAWLPNPAVASIEQLKRAKPPNALLTLAREMLGLTDDAGRSIYLSDGGHFENLGIYEMVRRQCRFILVVDAGQDGDAKFTDLGNAARKIFIDFGVRITFHPTMAIGSREDPIKPIRGYATADIKYLDPPKIGKLIYIRPYDMPDAPIDVRAFRNAHPDFPHETTLEQWFSESRFESYRGLGDAAMSAIGLPESDPNDTERQIADLFRDVASQIQIKSKSDPDAAADS